MLLFQQNLQTSAPTATLTGQQASSSQGSIAASTSDLTTGQQFAAFAGNLVGSAAVGASGQQTSTSQGSTGTANTGAVIGQQAGAQPGTLARTITISVSGLLFSVTQGITFGSITDSISGQQASLQQGTTTATQFVSTSLTGVQTLVAPGTIGVGAVGVMGGQSTSTSTGTLVFAPGLRSQIITSAQGSLSGQQTIAGASTTILSGVVAVVPAVVLSSASIATLPGQLKESDSEMPVGMQTTISQGMVGVVLVQSNTGQSASLGQGDLIASQFKTVAIIGTGFSGVDGAMAATTSTPTNGQPIGTANGSVFVSGGSNLSGLTTSTQYGVLSKDSSKSITGATLTVDEGTSRFDVSGLLSGADITSLHGVLHSSQTIDATLTGASIVTQQARSRWDLFVAGLLDELGNEIFQAVIP